MRPNEENQRDIENLTDVNKRESNMTDINEIRFSGTILILQSINTKSGVTMATLLLEVSQDKFKCVAFKNVAEAILRLRGADQISVAGSGSINSWKDNQGHWHNDFQLSVWECEIDGKVTQYKKKPGNSGQGNNSKPNDPPLPPEPNQLGDQHSKFDYTGGSF